MEIDYNNGILFKTVSGDSLTFPCPPEIRLMDVAASAFRSVIKDTTFSVIIYDQACINDMSGDTLPKLVEVSFGSNRYRGCGKFTYDYRINDIWVLNTLNGNKVTSGEAAKSSLRLEFNIAQQKFLALRAVENIRPTLNHVAASSRLGE